MINTYIDMDKERTILKIRIENYENEILHLQKQARLFGPSEVKGVDYESTPVQTTVQIGFAECIDRIAKINNHILIHKDRLQYLEGKLKEIENLIKTTEGRHQQILYYRIIKGYTQERAAEEVDCNVRTVKRVEKINKSIIDKCINKKLY